MWSQVISLKVVFSKFNAINIYPTVYNVLIIFWLIVIFDCYSKHLKNINCALFLILK